ncbi:hypothetical protein NDU88_002372 [Pleurodeles waltl]|uniref:Reverse transcriptase domain-containing protein n=1 Tax=Pleurodeles waltl TaxID=8319 RepID=A0AAV7M3X9_PLEWA|nr:hypothetical protein NDU88_002372 [Pleurodeles waltl]
MWPRAQHFLQSNGEIKSRPQQSNNLGRHKQSPPPPIVDSVSIGVPIPASAAPSVDNPVPRPGWVTAIPGVVPKKDPGQFRLIHNLSAPRGASVNEAIDPVLCSVRYTTVDQALEKLRVLGRGTLLAKTDIEAAFRLLPVHPEDYHLLGFQFNRDYFYDVYAHGVQCVLQLFQAV